jgi:hypothetical protein
MWKDKAFCVLCIAILLQWTAQYAQDLAVIMFWIEGEHRSVDEWPLMFLPLPIVGLLDIGLMGIALQRVTALELTTSGIIIALFAPLSLVWTNATSTYFASSKYTFAL